MRVHIVRIVRAEMAVPSSGRSGLPRVDTTTTGHRCWSTRRYHAWTKRITVPAAGSKANANDGCLPSRASPVACRWTGRRGDARARASARTTGRTRGVRTSSYGVGSFCRRGSRMKLAIYARYSSENQRDPSIADRSALEPEHDSRKSGARHRHSPQRALHRSSGVESAAVPEGSRHRQACRADESAV